MSGHSLNLSVKRLKSWAVSQALPIWAERAQLSDGSWVEHLNLDGTPDMSAERRWRVLARQVYVYAQAAAAEWFDGQDIAQNTQRRMMETGYVHRVAMDGTINNPTQDLYDHAFYLLSQASLYKLTREPQYLQQAETILAWLDHEMSHPKGGWTEYAGAPPDEIRRQNPHMHIFEASLYLYGITQNPTHLAYAHKVFALFEQPQKVQPQNRGTPRNGYGCCCNMKKRAAWIPHATPALFTQACIAIRNISSMTRTMKWEKLAAKVSGFGCKPNLLKPISRRRNAALREAQIWPRR